MRLSRGKRGNPERFEKLGQYTGKKDKNSGKSGTNARKDRIFVSDRKEDPKPEAPAIITAEPKRPERVEIASPARPAGPPKRPPSKPAKAAPPPPRRSRRLRSVFRYTLLVLFLLMTLVTGAGIQVLHLYLKELPAPEALERYRPMLISRLYSSDRQLIGEYVRERRKLVSIQEVPKQLSLAIVAREDKHYYSHFGVDPWGVTRAVVANLKAGRAKEGGSTLTQQLVKNLTNEREKAMERKIKEAMLALKTERTYSKDEILEMYLNQVYFGHGCYGIGSAAEYYFGKEVKDLNLNECAMLAGLIQRPSRYSPFVNPERARIRRLSVLRRMFEDGYISETELNEASQQPLRLANPSTLRRTQKNLAPYLYEYIRLSLDQAERLKENGSSLTGYPFETPAVGEIGIDRLYADGLSIETTIDFDLQHIATEALRRGVREVEKVRRLNPSYWGEPKERVVINTVLEEGKWYDAKIVRSLGPNRVEVELPHVPKAPGGYPVEIDPENSWLSEFEVTAPGYWLQVVAQRDGTGNWMFAPAPEPHVQASLVALEVETGKLLALVGGYDFFESQTGAKLIHPFQGMYQPGSCFKPILFACAYSRGMTPSDTIDELPLEYNLGSRIWSIENFESTRWNPSLHGVTPLRRALVKSMNVASVHLWNLLTQDNRQNTVVHFSRDNMGLRSPVRLERASALGTCEVYPIELAAVYAALANGGRRIRPFAIEQIADNYGNTLVRQYPESEPILRDPRQAVQVAYQVTQNLKDVLEDPEGTGYRTIRELYPEGFPYRVAGKTGTTNDCSDAWFVGYNPHIVTCVWVGFEDKKSLGEKMTGSRAALPIWAEFMEKAIPIYAKREGAEDPAAVDFPVPPGMVFVEVCRKSGGRANAYCRQAGRSVMEAFIAGTEPARTCDYHGTRDLEALDEFIDSQIVSGDTRSTYRF